MGIEEVLSAPRSPWQRAYAPGVFGSRDRTQRGFSSSQPNGLFAYFHKWRTHLSLGKDAPTSRRTQPPQQGRVIEMPQSAACTTTTNTGPIDFGPARR